MRVFFSSFPLSCLPVILASLSSSFPSAMPSSLIKHSKRYCISYSNKVIAFSFVTSASSNVWKKRRYKINEWTRGWMSGS